MTPTHPPQSLPLKPSEVLEKAAPVADVNGYGPDLYTDAHAERLKPHAGEPYQPSNGTEGEMFMGMWCAHCTKDPGFEAIVAGADGCEIIADTMCLGADDPDYPREWQYSTRGQPICTAFASLAREEGR